MLEIDFEKGQWKIDSNWKQIFLTWWALDVAVSETFDVWLAAEALNCHPTCLVGTREIAKNVMMDVTINPGNITGIT